ncbi:hypothetical protein MNV49_002953 [Pseudohyphozyma bogoriensis]|nr:hypothetical protein MNV49_002953 [Pseudohyphozyma bogoriensis]
MDLLDASFTFEPSSGSGTSPPTYGFSPLVPTSAVLVQTNPQPQLVEGDSLDGILSDLGAAFSAHPQSQRTAKSSSSSSTSSSSSGSASTPTASPTLTPLDLPQSPPPAPLIDIAPTPCLPPPTSPTTAKPTARFHPPNPKYAASIVRNPSPLKQVVFGRTVSESSVDESGSESETESESSSIGTPSKDVRVRGGVRSRSVSPMKVLQASVNMGDVSTDSVMLPPASDCSWLLDSNDSFLNDVPSDLTLASASSTSFDFPVPANNDEEEDLNEAMSMANVLKDLPDSPIASMSTSILPMELTSATPHARSRPTSLALPSKSELTSTTSRPLYPTDLSVNPSSAMPYQSTLPRGFVVPSVHRAPSPPNLPSPADSPTCDRSSALLSADESHFLNSSTASYREYRDSPVKPAAGGPSAAGRRVVTGFGLVEKEEQQTSEEWDGGKTPMRKGLGSLKEFLQSDGGAKKEEGGSPESASGSNSSGELEKWLMRAGKSAGDLTGLNDLSPPTALIRSAADPTMTMEMGLPSPIQPTSLSQPSNATSSTTSRPLSLPHRPSHARTDSASTVIAEGDLLGFEVDGLDSLAMERDLSAERLSETMAAKAATMQTPVAKRVEKSMVDETPRPGVQHVQKQKKRADLLVDISDEGEAEEEGDDVAELRGSMGVGREAGGTAAANLVSTTTSALPQPPTSVSVAPTTGKRRRPSLLPPPSSTKKLLDSIGVSAPPATTTTTTIAPLPIKKALPDFGIGATPKSARKESTQERLDRWREEKKVREGKSPVKEKSAVGTVGLERRKSISTTAGTSRMRAPRPSIGGGGVGGRAGAGGIPPPSSSTASSNGLGASQSSLSSSTSKVTTLADALANKGTSLASRNKFSAIVPPSRHNSASSSTAGTGPRAGGVSRVMGASTGAGAGAGAASGLASSTGRRMSAVPAPSTTSKPSVSPAKSRLSIARNENTGLGGSVGAGTGLKRTSSLNRSATSGLSASGGIGIGRPKSVGSGSAVLGASGRGFGVPRTGTGAKP